MNNLEGLLGERKKTLKIGKQSIDIYPMKLKNLGLVMQKKDVVLSIFKGDILETLSKNFDDVIELVCSISGQEKEFVENLELPQVIDFIEAIIEMNKEGFFLMQEKLKNLTKELPAKKANLNGQKQSSTSSKKDTASKESRTTQ